jgi:cystathionine beta-synthase
LAHVETTGPELWDQTDGRIDIFVAGAGTGGTISGTGKFLKSKKPSVKIVGADPDGSLLTELFHTGKMVSASKPYFVEGIGQDYHPKNVQMEFIDEFMTVTDHEAMHKCRELLRLEGICSGPSAGTALVAAINYSAQFTEPKVIVVLIPDSGTKYLSKVFNDAWMKEKGLL